MKKFLSKWARKTLLKADGIDDKLTRIKCNVHVDSDDIAALNTVIDQMIKFRESIKDRYNIQ